MSKYFSVNDYAHLPQEGKDIIDAWFASNNIDPTMVTMIQSGIVGREGLVISGLPNASREMNEMDTKILRTLPEDTFPWEKIAPHFMDQDSEGFLIEGVAYGTNK